MPPSNVIALADWVWPNIPVTMHTLCLGVLLLLLLPRPVRACRREPPAPLTSTEYSSAGNGPKDSPDERGPTAEGRSYLWRDQHVSGPQTRLAVQANLEPVVQMLCGAAAAHLEVKIRAQALMHMPLLVASCLGASASFCFVSLLHECLQATAGLKL